MAFLGHRQKMVRRLRRAYRIDRNLDIAVGAVLETDRARQPRREFAVYLRFGRARADRAAARDVRRRVADHDAGPAVDGAAEVVGGTIAGEGSEDGAILVVAADTDLVTWKSVSNLGFVHAITPGQLNTYDVLVSDDVVFLKDAYESFIAGPAAGRSAKAVATSTEAQESAE